MRILVGISGASGSVLAVKLLQRLRELNQEVHLVISEWGAKNVKLETDLSLDELKGLAFRSYQNNDLGAAVASGSFPVDAMIIIPCSMKTLAAVANGFSINLIARAADVFIKERRKLVMVTRETPLSSIHLRNMLTLSDMGVSIMPPVPAFYNRLGNMEEMADAFVGRLIGHLGISDKFCRQWQGTE